jgi:O-acetyl-ADP-ribose deacetylase (regulator of RNase III)
MSPSKRKKNCFVIMPFGKKRVHDGMVIDTEGDGPSAGAMEGKIVDFEHIYHFLIEKTITEMDINCVKANRIPHSGWIHFQMFHQIYNSDVTIVDITALNPNVFYELGVRHALAEHATILLRQRGTRIPFNINGLNVIEYPDDLTDETQVNRTKEKIKAFVQNGLDLQHVDSPVHNVLKLKIGMEPKHITKEDIIPYALTSAMGKPKQICLITGDLQNIRKKIDVWVSSENTDMEMSRHYERSISAIVRYHGAKRDSNGRVIDDIVAKELAEKVGHDKHVLPGTVIATGSGELLRTHGVKKIFHAAAVFGQIGKGYSPIADMGVCVRNALKLANEELKAENLRSILFPLMGTGTGRGALEPIVKQLIDAAIAYLEANPRCKIQEVYFLVWSQQELAACKNVLRQAPEATAQSTADTAS